MDEVGDPRPARVLDDDAITGQHVGLQEPFDPVERAADDRYVALHAVRGEVGLGEFDQALQLVRAAVELVLRVDGRERLRQWGEELPDRGSRWRGPALRRGARRPA